MTMRVDPEFARLSQAALENPRLGEALQEVEHVMPAIRDAALGQLDYAAARDRATAIKDHTLQHLGHYLSAFEAEVKAQDGHVHFARDAAEACRIITELSAGANLIAKSKSMVTEEIELNEALEAEGLKVVETDLGEYIIQLRNEKPSHILAPALHVSLDEVIESFNANHAVERDEPLTEADQLLAEARSVLRETFLQADVGITGANFLVAETGTAVIVTNEGNADLTASLPDTHIVVTGIEKLVPTLDDAGLMLRLLARSAIGQRLSNYTSFIQGPRRQNESSGPAHFHVVLVDNGRSAMLGTPLQPMLRCIRCSACINHCPVYTAVGGHAYGSVYPGPMGAVLTPGFAGLRGVRHMPNASTLCGRCESVCPVSIPIPQLLRHWRAQEFERHIRPLPERFGLRLWARLATGGLAYRAAQAIAALTLRIIGRDGWARRLPLLGAGWTRHRDMPVPKGGTFQQQWGRRS